MRVIRLADAATGRLMALPERVSWYICGPTVYDDAHIGHGRTFVCLDLARKAMWDAGHQVDCAMGITDVDDKILERGGDQYAQLAAEMESRFRTDMAALGVEPPDAYLRVSQHMPDIIDMARSLEEKGYAYRLHDGLYFDTCRFEHDGFTYNKLRPRTGDAGPGRGRKDPRDFSLWRCDKGSWDSPWGKGRPGWHIECSAMIGSYFGERVHLHAGGVDLAFPHHVNETAQSEACYGCHDWVQHWMHTGHVHIQGRKMSKSLKNFTTVRDLLQEHSPEAFRVFCMSHKYASHVEFGPDRMADAARVLSRFRHICKRIRDLPRCSTKPDDRSKQLAYDHARLLRLAQDAVFHDLDFPSMLGHFLDLCRCTNVYLDTSSTLHTPTLASICGSLERMGATYGLHIAPTAVSTGPGLEPILDASVSFRTTVRSAALTLPNDARSPLLAAADTYRAALGREGVLLQDGERPSWTRQ